MRMRLWRPRLTRTALTALCGIVALTAGVARADITLERTMAVEGVGAMAFGNMSGTTTTTISGDKSRTDSDIKMQSKLVRFLARNAMGPSADIVRLDEDKIYHLNINKKEYTETTFEQMRQQARTMSDQMASADEKKQPTAIDESKCEWLPPKAEVRKTGEKAQFAGYDAERVTITASQPCKEKESGSICEVALVLDEWLSSGFTEAAEVQRFYKAYAAKMGLDPSSSQDISQKAQALFSRYQGVWSQIATKMQGVKGYPVKSSFTLALGGPECKNSNAQQAHSAPGGAGGPDNSGSSDSSSQGSLAGAVAGKLGGLFHKKKDDAEPAAQPAPATTPVAIPPGDVPLMTVSSQLISVSTNGASAAVFTVPADFKKQEPKTP
jgi:hypothetical protein